MKGGLFEKILSSKSKTFLAFCFCFLLGVTIFSFANTQVFPRSIFTAFIVSIACIIVFWKEKLLWFFSSCIFLFLLGLVRVNFAIPSYDESNIAFYNGQKVQVQGFVSSEADLRIENVHYFLNIEKIYRQGSWKEIHGKIALTLPLYPRYNYGQNVAADCQLKTPEPLENFHYEKYLATKNVYSICQSPSINILEGNSGNALFHFLYTFKNIVAEKISLLWHEPYASFVAGLLYGYRGGLGTLSEDFNRTGVTHIVAVSGFNITLIATLMSSFLIYLCIKRQYAFWIVGVSIFFFVIFTGASASVVRAGIMGMLALTARQVGRNSSLKNVLIFTAALMAFQNPFILLWDLGFQLSFLSTCGLIYLSPLLETYLQKIPQFLNFRESLTSTVSAIIFTLPLLLFQFGRLSLLAPLVNILVLPLIPWLMAFAFASVMISFISFPSAKVFGFITYLGLKYIVLVVQFFSHLPFAVMDFSLSFWGMIFLYAVLFFFLRKTLLKFEKNVVY